MQTPKLDFIGNNHAEIKIAGQGTYLQSYDVLIAFVPENDGGKILLDEKYWDYSKTTGRYRNQFLGETKKEIVAKISSGEYQLTNLNKK